MLHILEYVYKINLIGANLLYLHSSALHFIENCFGHY